MPQNLEHAKTLLLLRAQSNVFLVQVFISLSVFISLYMSMDSHWALLYLHIFRIRKMHVGSNQNATVPTKKVQIDL